MVLPAEVIVELFLEIVCFLPELSCAVLGIPPSATTVMRPPPACISNVPGFIEGVILDLPLRGRFVQTV